MAITGGFGFEYDKKTGNIRRWYCGADGVRRWQSNDMPCDSNQESDLWRCTVCGRIGTVGRCCGENTREPVHVKCKGSGNDVDGWREGCERCQRREGNDEEGVEFMAAPEIIVFECPFLIEKAED